MPDERSRCRYDRFFAPEALAQPLEVPGIKVPAVNKSTRDAFNSTQDCQQMAIVPHRRASERKKAR
jgi:hypothetical protein